MIREHNKRKQMETLLCITLPYAYLQFTPSITFAYFRYYVNIGYIKTRTNVKSSIVPEEGWFGQPKYSTPSKKSFYVVSVFAFVFFILYVKPIRSLLIQRIPADHRSGCLLKHFIVL